MSTEYHKIETLFERGPDFTVDTAKLKKPVLATIKEWDVTEKIDGMNIRVDYQAVAGARPDTLNFYGRTDNAQLPGDLCKFLFEKFPIDKFREKFQSDVVLYGEGYGGNIQKGSAYRLDKSFILFDVLVDGKWWLDKDGVDDIGAFFNVDVVPYFGRMTLDEIVAKVQTPFQSSIGTALSEGVVARPIETLFDKRGQRIIIKLKTRDFTGGKR